MRCQMVGRSRCARAQLLFGWSGARRGQRRSRRANAAAPVGRQGSVYRQYDGMANQLLGGASAEPFSMSIDQALPKGLPYEKIPTGAQP